MSKIMPIERLATIIANAAVDAATQVTGIFSNKRMTWTEQGVHAAAWNAIRNDGEVERALHMMQLDAIADHVAENGAEHVERMWPSAGVMIAARRSGNAAIIVEALRHVWMDVPFEDADDARAHAKAFDDMIEHLQKPGRR